MKPVVVSNEDFSNFDKEFINEEVQDTPIVGISKINNTNYDGFTYARPKLDTGDNGKRLN